MKFLNNISDSGMINEVIDKRFISDSEKTKLSGIDTNANNYSHPTDDGSKHVPANGTTNNGKVLKAGATAGTYIWSNDNDTITTINGKTGTITKADITALGIPSQDTVYTHPANHLPAIITQDANNRFVTDTEKSTWNGKAESSHTHTKSQITDFPTSMTPTAHNQAGTTITVADSGGYFTGTNAETVLQEIGSTLNGLEAAITAIVG